MFRDTAFELVFSWHSEFKTSKKKSSDNLWGVYMRISAVIAAVSFACLGFGGIFALPTLPTAIALVVPLCILGVGVY